MTFLLHIHALGYGCKSAQQWHAIIRSSPVGITYADALPPSAASSIRNPINAACSHPLVESNGRGNVPSNPSKSLFERVLDGLGRGAVARRFI
jgi:hypothetical protein